VSAASVTKGVTTTAAVASSSTLLLTSEELFQIRLTLKVANEQLLICRRVLKFTYVFAFYHFMDAGETTTTTTSLSEKNCFEHHQGILEGLTENLSKLCETTSEVLATMTTDPDPDPETNALSSKWKSKSSKSKSCTTKTTIDSVQDIVNQTR